MRQQVSPTSDINPPSPPDWNEGYAEFKHTKAAAPLGRLPEASRATCKPRLESTVQEKPWELRSVTIRNIGAQIYVNSIMGSKTPILIIKAPILSEFKTV